MTTLGHSETHQRSTSSLEVSHARTLATPDCEQESEASEAASSGISCEWFAKLSHDMSYWRTWQRCLFGEWERFCGSWPRAGTMQNGTVYRRRPLVLISEATAFSSSPTVPRPVACDGKGSGRIRHERLQGMNLRDWWNVNYRFVYPPVRISEYLMGFPVGWTDLGESETQSFRKSRSTSRKGSSKRTA